MLILVIVILLLAGFAIAGFTGAPYVPILKRDRAAILDLAGLKSGQTLIDLGCGDGYLLRLAASRGLTCVGYEINPVMVIVAKILCFKQRRRITIHQANFWHIKLPPADVIYVFLMPKFMGRLGGYLRQQCQRRTTVISYAFAIPNTPPDKQTANSYLYHFGPTDHPLEESRSRL